MEKIEKPATELYAGIQAIAQMRKEIREIVTEIGNSITLHWLESRGQPVDHGLVVYIGDWWSVELVGEDLVIRSQNTILFHTRGGFQEPPLHDVVRLRRELDDHFVPGLLDGRSYLSSRAETFFAAAKGLPVTF